MHVHNFCKKKIICIQTDPGFLSSHIEGLRANENNVNDSIYWKYTNKLLHSDLFLRPSWWKSGATDIIFTISAALAYFGNFFGK